jgi:hypothetical protein
MENIQLVRILICIGQECFSAHIPEIKEENRGNYLLVNILVEHVVA